MRKRPDNEVHKPTPIFSEHVQPMYVKPGDKVMFYFLAGKVCPKWPDDDHIIVPESSIQLVLE